VKEPVSGPQYIRKAVARASAALICFTALHGAGQSYSVLHRFHGDDGKWPYGGLVESSNVLYGSTRGLIYQPGADNWGEIFKINKDGSGFTVLHQFNGHDGSALQGRLVISGATLYGTTSGGGNGFGTVFKINTDGTGFTTLNNFQGSPDAARPMSGLLLSGSTLFGTAAGQGTYPANSAGAVYRIETDGSYYAVLKTFSGPDGSMPLAPLVRSGPYLFGTTANGGNGGNGTLFTMWAGGPGFLTLHHFLGNPDGAVPEGELLLIGATPFGTTWAGGTSDKGTIYRINTDGTGYQVLKSLSWGPDGAFPETGLIQYGGTLLGIARAGGTFGIGTIFALGLDGSGFTKLWDFPGQNGSNPRAELLLSGTTLYGTAQDGGGFRVGAVFRLQLISDSITPPAQTTEVGTSPRLRLADLRAVPASYQWALNQTNVLAGETNADLILTNAQPSQSGSYTCTVSNAFGTTTSSGAALSVIPHLQRRPVPALALSGQPGTSFAVEYADDLVSGGPWSTLTSLALTNSSQLTFDTSAPLPSQRFYRARNTDTNNPPGVTISMAEEITITGAPSQTVRLDYISPIGPTDAWSTLATLPLTNSPQVYFDAASPFQGRLYRIVPLP
jgi:uncharacterized repeat protein (TIGR03803 family)